MRALVRASIAPPNVASAVCVSLVVGTVLNAINQGSTLLAGGPVSWPHLFLNYLVPYCVASYSGVTARLRREQE